MENKQTLDFDKICQWFKDGEKKRENWLIGTEHEKFLFKKNEFKRLSYEDLKGIKFILNKIAEEEDWEKISENNNLIGLKHKSGSSISLEPGGQFELSGAPLKNLHMTCNEAGLHLNLMKKISNELDFVMLGLGYDPISKRDQINWMPKNRYEIMKNHMPKVGNLGIDMMIRTCTIQVNLDYLDEKDMIKKFQTSLALQPIVTALFSNSPFTEGKLSKYLSLRAYTWTDTDSKRSGFPNIVFSKDFGYEAWTEYLLSVPMYFIYDNGKYYDVAGKSFSKFMDGKLEGFEGKVPTLSYWEDHVTVAFPEVRLKQYLEMRGADGGPWNRICALPAFWVGLLYDQKSLDDSFHVAKKFMDVSLLEESRISAAKFGLNGIIGDSKIIDVAQDLLNISFEGLERRNFKDKNGISETQFLDPLLNILENGQTPADDLLKKFNGVWKKDIYKIFTISN